MRKSKYKYLYSFLAIGLLTGLAMLFPPSGASATVNPTTTIELTATSGRQYLGSIPVLHSGRSVACEADANHVVCYTETGFLLDAWVPDVCRLVTFEAVDSTNQKGAYPVLTFSDPGDISNKHGCGWASKYTYGYGTGSFHGPFTIVSKFGNSFIGGEEGSMTINWSKGEYVRKHPISANGRKNTEVLFYYMPAYYY